MQSSFIFNIAAALICSACASTGISTNSDKIPIEHLTTIEAGNARLTCGLACSGAWGAARRGNRALFDQGLWEDLALRVASVGYKSDLSYFYLGRASEGLKKADAAIVYYKLALASDSHCAGAFNNCSGFNFPSDITVRLEQLLLAKADAERKLIPRVRDLPFTSEAPPQHRSPEMLPALATGPVTPSDEKSIEPQEKRNPFSKNFHGDSIENLIDQLNILEKSSRDEFIKPRDLEVKRALIQNKTYRFVIPVSINKKFDSKNQSISGAKYNAESEILSANLWIRNETFRVKNSKSKSSSSLFSYATIGVSEKYTRSQYVGQNAYGAKANITSRTVTESGLAVANLNLTDGSAIFTLSIPVKPQSAKSLRDDVSFYADVEAITSSDFTDNVLEKISGHEATISNPSEFYHSGRYVLVNIKEIGAYRKSSGEVLGWKSLQ